MRFFHFANIVNAIKNLIVLTNINGQASSIVMNYKSPAFVMYYKSPAFGWTFFQLDVI